MARHVFLTGPPGVGKTTLIRKASELLQSSGVPVDGFYTEEVRQGGRRTGFDVVTLSGARGPLSRVGSEPQPGKRDYRVGQYVVDLTSFEQLALPVLKNVPAAAQGRECVSSTRSGRWSSSASPSSSLSARHCPRQALWSLEQSQSPKGNPWPSWRRSGAGPT
ncbi:cancer-related nucleoside-triphosphatase isoform X5 [Fukomys damarensis]|uniref:cancer-related nucleoside-triphosphatase isoform X5 n=1 Tax=Fukomys damarensis TaxID=885580 RepID=UPI0014557F7F|nr:cancer-related nucleoside-triphosphatase isoform X5 [Fukomys damarensis]XP_019062721.2 cancer-related nucleoside-triphosphatase isoform X5 [Fukomys damarensis]XP_019062722.2 cancer-related nucleoside-triphosphatase isoform X5 [Fukomys damarensis]XP_019062723.2 cancer-related nucleoside-triphosphatase isoform X5 [Fukomys damarensis]XP_019062724.2 cancer-related nucleoside-triphosphatase isoform X5 [Fukomys damarensis]